MQKEYKPISFPEDEGAHDSTIEWWYFNGHLEAADGRRFAYMDCLFKVKVKEVGAPIFSHLPLKKLHFSHSLVTDLGTGEFRHRVAPYSILSEDSFTRPLLFANYVNPQLKTTYTNCAIEQLDEKTYRVKNEDLDLTLARTKAPLLQCGNGFIEVRGEPSYYYSMTNLQTTGRLRVGGEWLEVRGKSWMDHQWADTRWANDRWDWFAIQLEDGTEITCQDYSGGDVKIRHCDVSYPDGSTELLEGFDLTPGERSWKSRKSQATYPVEWHLKVPSKGIDLKLSAPVEDQEMLFGSVNYWEGPLQVEGTFAGKPAKGVGFMELVGYLSKYGNVDYLRDEIKKFLKLKF